MPHTVAILSGELEALRQAGAIAKDSFLLFVDDGSRDATWSLIEHAHSEGQANGLRLARNFGHQKALLAGLLRVGDNVDCAITIDADLQDDPGVVRKMVDHYRDGYEVVCATNACRDTDTFFKRTSATFYYRLLGLLQIGVIKDHADFRLLGRQALEALSGHSERNLYLRGLVPMLSDRVAIVTQSRRRREAGDTKYTFWRMLSLAWDGVTSFSIAPLRLMLVAGFMVFCLSLLLACYVLWSRLFGDYVPGWASTVLPIYLLGGLQLLGIGLIGEYLGKIYMEVKRRPRFIVDRDLGP